MIDDKTQKRDQKRCPSCMSPNIYKRIRRDGLSKYKDTIKKCGKCGNRNKTLVKQYICRICGHEFNNPIYRLKTKTKNK